MRARITSALIHRNRTIIIVHVYARTIRVQYTRRHLISTLRPFVLSDLITVNLNSYYAYLYQTCGSWFYFFFFYYSQYSSFRPWLSTRNVIFLLVFSYTPNNDKGRQIKCSRLIIIRNVKFYCPPIRTYIIYCTRSKP